MQVSQQFKDSVAMLMQKRANKFTDALSNGADAVRTQWNALGDTSKGAIIGAGGGALGGALLNYITNRGILPGMLAGGAAGAATGAAVGLFKGKKKDEAAAASAEQKTEAATKLNAESDEILAANPNSVVAKAEAANGRPATPEEEAKAKQDMLDGKKTTAKNQVGVMATLLAPAANTNLDAKPTKPKKKE